MRTGTGDLLTGMQSGGDTEPAGRAALRSWKQGVETRPILDRGDLHSIHSYYSTCPESPDGRRVVLFASETAEAHEGSVVVVDRETGKATTLASAVTTEDAHRVACQQWISGGRRVVYHDVRDGTWRVVVVDVESGEQRVAATDRQLGWGRPDADLVPLYGLHWDPAAGRDLELLDAATGEIATVLTAAEVRASCREWITGLFDASPISVFLPCLSPDLRRVFFKIAAPGGGHFRSPEASKRAGLVCWDLADRRLLFVRDDWGHPAWHPDSRSIINVPNVLIDAESGVERRFPRLPVFPGSHPSIGPDGGTFATDVRDGKEWGVVVGDLLSGEHIVISRFRGDNGATSWRPPHPHPAFSRDGTRLYFNVSATGRTVLHVAQAGG